MKTTIVMRTAIQTVSVAFGLLGLSWACVGVYWGVTSVRGSDCFLGVGVGVYGLILGLLAVAITRRILWHFDSAAIKNLVGVVAFFTFFGTCRLMDAFVKPEGHPLGNVFLFFVCVVLTIWLYRAVSWILIQMTGVRATE